MKLERVFSEFGSISDVKAIQFLTDMVILYSPEPFIEVIPSIVLGSDGLALDRLILLSRTLMCDLRLRTGQIDFDYTAKNSIGNYRFMLGTHVIKREGQSNIFYETATVRLVHYHLPTFSTEIEYVGPDRQSWINDVLRLLPLSIVCDAV